MALEVIGVGFGRTGTDSLREALNILGFGPCHHMFEVTQNPVMKSRWRTFMTDGVPDWEALYEGYRSCVDWPSVHFWRELTGANADAKVVLTLRDSESWWASFEATLLRFYNTTKDRESVGVRIMDKAFGGHVGDKEFVIRAYEDHNAEVMATIPKERLLVHNLGDGWEPLCTHLDVPIPAEPYPRRNTTADHNSNVSNGES